MKYIIHVVYLFTTMASMLDIHKQLIHGIIVSRLRKLAQSGHIQRISITDSAAEATWKKMRPKKD